MSSVKDHAIVLRLLDWSETSQIAVLLTAQHGKISATAKGAKRQTPSTLAKFSGGLELLSRGEAVFIPKRGSELANLTEWDLLDAHWHLRRNLRALNLAMYGADLVHHLVQDADPHLGTFTALARFFRDLAGPEGSGGGGIQAALLRFQWALVMDLGFGPVLDRDAQTGAELGGGQTVGFSAIHGGTVADTGASDRWRVRRSTIELLSRIAAGQRGVGGGGGSDEMVEVGGAEVGGDAEVVERANKLLCVYFRAILDRSLPTMEAVLGTGGTGGGGTT
jgi:DNA repair protein RecO (recombination protein O)